MSKKAVNMLLIVTAGIVTASAVNTYAATTYGTPTDSEFKTFMDYREITSRTSEQYKLQTKCTTTDAGLRVYNGRYCIAIGTAFNAKVWDFVTVELSSGEVLDCIVADIKRDCDTDWTNMQVDFNGNVVEFVVDKSALSYDVKVHGTVHNLEGLAGDVVNITVLDSSDESTLDWKTVGENQMDSNKYTVIDKYPVTVGDDTVYVVEYISNSDCNTLEVDAGIYESLIIGQSTITVQ